MQPATICKFDCWKRLFWLDLDNGEVRAEVPLYGAIEHGAIRKLDSYLAILRTFNDVVVGEDIAIRAYDNT